ncbi:MAG: tetratricopeptide repeat protein [Kiritimatiellales bacterium]
MKRRSFFILAFPVFAGLFFFSCGQKPGEKIYHEAMVEWQKGHLVRARALLEKSIRRRAGSLENAGACNQLGLLLYETGDIAGAVNAFTESNRIDPAQYEVLCNLGVALSVNNDPGEAERVFREASLMNPADARPLTFAGAVFLRNKKWAEAERNLHRAIQRNPADPRIQNALALAELHTGKTGDALKRLQTAARQNSGYAPAIFNIAVIQQKWINNSGEAKKEFERYLTVTKNSGAYAGFAREQIELISGTPAIIPSTGARNRAVAERFFRTGFAAYRDKRYDDAIKNLRQAVAGDETYEQAFLNLGLAYYAQGRNKEAGEAFTHAVQLNPAFTSARYNNALVYCRLGNTSAALRELNTVLEQQPKYQPAIDLKALLQR